MGSDIQRINDAISYVFFGLHNAPKRHKVNSHYEAVAVNTMHDLATFDSDKLTRIVIASHRYCVRISVEQSGPHRVKLIFWARQSRTGGFASRHPDLRQLAKLCIDIAEDDEKGKS